MNKRKLLYSSRVAKGINVEIPEFDWCPVSITRTVTRRDNGGDTMEKPAKGKVFDPKSPDTRIFCILEGQDVPEKEIIHDENYIKEIGVLNAAPGFIDCITITGDSFETMNGMEFRCVGKQLEFRIV